MHIVIYILFIYGYAALDKTKKIWENFLRIVKTIFPFYILDLIGA